MKRIVVLSIAIIAVVLSGCSGPELQEKFESFMSNLVSRDAEHQQGFKDLTRDQVYDHYNERSKGLDLSSMGLAKVPDLCSLIDEVDYHDVWHISLANNNIKAVDVDLSCFKFLQTLNLSYNNITTIKSVGELPMLKSFSLKKNELADTSGLPALPSLETLNLGYNQLKEVTNVEQYQYLKELELQHNLIELIVGVENLDNLEKIKLEFNKLQDLNFLEGLESLELVTAKGNEIADTLLEKWDQLNQTYLQNQKSEVDSGSSAE